MNLISEIAEKLGVELGEEFEVLPKTAAPGYKSSRYRFSEQGLEFSNYIHCPSETGWSPTDTITGLLNGKISIIKLPYKPKKDDLYFCVKWDGDTLYTDDYVWDGRSYVDYLMMYSGNVFRTKSEAERAKYAVYERLTGKKWEQDDE